MAAELRFEDLLRKYIDPLSVCVFPTQVVQKVDGDEEKVEQGRYNSRHN